jgi:endonuclease/exonuclease/phosphatase (EEP) superfamily protein YafD
MRVLSLNVAQLAGRSALIPLAPLLAPRVAPRLAALIAREAPDALALQEAPRSHVASLLPGTVVRPNSRAHGPALVTMSAPVRPRAELFVPGSGDGKGYALAYVEDLLLVSIHLAVLRRSTRRRQIDELARVLAGYEGEKLVVGDINDARDAPSYLAERLGLVSCSPGPTFPSYAPRLSLDWAFVSRGVRVRRIERLTHLPSDHCALVLDVDTKRREQPGGPAC